MPGDPFFSPSPRTFGGDPYPPPKAPDAPKTVDTSSAPATSAGTGALPPEAQQGAPGRPGSGPQPTYTVTQAPDGSRGVFEWGKDGPVRIGDVSAADADKVLAAAAPYDDASKTWRNVPPDIAKSLVAGGLGFPERVSQAWEGGEASVVGNLIWSRMLKGELDGNAAAEQAHPDLVKAQLQTNPAVAWQGNLGDTLKAWANHPVAAAEEGAVQAVNMAPMMKDILLHGTMPGAAKGIAAGGAAAGAALATGPLAPETALAAVTGAAQVGAAYGTGERAYQLFAGQFAAHMHEQGYDDVAIRKYAPVAGLVNAALTTAQFDLMTPSMQSAFVEKLAGSEGAKKAIAEALVKYAGRTAGFSGINGAMQVVNDYVGNMAATAQQRPDLLVSGRDMAHNFVSTSLETMMAGGVVAGATGALEAAGGRLGQSQARRGEPGLGRVLGTPTSSGEGEGLSRGSAGPAASATGMGSPEGTLPPGQPESPAPYQASVTEHPEGVKALEAAKPVLEREGVDGKDPAAVIALNEKVRDEAHDFRNAINAEYMTGSPERQALIEKEMQKHAVDIVAMDKLAKIARDPRGALTYYEAVARGETPETRPIDPYDEKRILGGGEKPAAGEPAAPQFFKPSEIDLEGQPADRRGGDEARKQIVGEKNEQIVRGNQIFSQFEKEIPDEQERAAITRYIDMGGDREKLRAAAANELLPEEDREPLPPASRAEYERALNLSPKALEWAKKLQAFYEQANEEGMARGTLDSTRENYINRLYLPEEEKSPNPGTKANALRRTTTHSFERYYETLYDAETSGKRLATTDAAALARIYNEEMAGVNANRAGLDNLAENGLGKWAQKAPEGWVKVGDLEKRVPIKDKMGQAVLGEDGNQLISKSNFYAPPGLAEGLKPLVDLDWTKKIPLLKSAIDFQNAVKSGLLSMSLFHDVTILSQAVNQHAIGTLLRGKSLDGLMDEDTFRNSEQWGVRHGLVTHEVLANMDVVRSLVKEPGIADAVKELPVVKQVLAANDAHTNFLFGKLSRYLKVMDFARQAANWEGKNGGATEAARTAALRDIARQVNAAYGGLNWEAMGMTKANLSLMRLAFLAPDWLVSNAQMAKMALGDLGVAGQRSRMHFATGLALGIVATEGLNKMFTGHFTDANKKGHKLEVEIAPDVYVSLFRGASGEAVKLGSMARDTEGGASVGGLRYVSSKVAPLPRAAVTLTGVAADHRFPNYYGKPIIPKGAGTVRGTYELLKALLEQTSPVPFSGSALVHYFGGGRPTLLGTAAVGSGVGRFSKSKSKGG